MDNNFVLRPSGIENDESKILTAHTFLLFHIDLIIYRNS